MLSAKQVKVHGMKDKRWTTRDRLNQYRGILKLHARDKKLREAEHIKLKKNVRRNLHSLEFDVKEYRRTFYKIATGNQDRLLRFTLQHHVDLQLAYGRLGANEIHAAIYKDSELKRRQLDKLYHEKRKRTQRFFDLSMEHDLLSSIAELEEPSNYKHQRLITHFQQAISKQNAAKAIRTTYLTMIDILKKDAIYFDAVLNTLTEDRSDQCKVILRATIMGQLATENYDDKRRLYKRMTRDVLINMKERERTLNSVREKVEDLWAYARSLVRVESDSAFTGETDDTTIAAHHFAMLEKQIVHLEEIFEKLKETLLVRTYKEIIPRLEQQEMQKKRLVTQFNRYREERDQLLTQKNEALLTLENLEHTMISTTGQYRTDKRIMQEQIEIEKKRSDDYEEQKKTRGDLKMKIRAALQNMFVMLIHIKRGSKASKKMATRSRGELSKKMKEKIDDIEVKEITESDEPLTIEVESNGLALLPQVSRKVGALFGMSSIELSKDNEARARDLYQTYVSNYQSNLHFHKNDLETIGLLVEHEVVDSSVLTRADIKLRSKQVVEANLKKE